MILKKLDHFKTLFTEYTELRIQENRQTHISIVNGDVMRNTQATISGVSARVYKDGCWGFASNPSINEEAIQKVILSATENACFLGSKENRNKPPLPKQPGHDEHDFSTGKPRLSQKEIITFLQTIDTHIQENFTDLSSRTIVCSCLDMEKSLLTSDDSSSHSMIPRAFIYVIMNTEIESKPYEMFQAYGGFGQFEDLFAQPEELFSSLQQQYQHLMNKAAGVYAQAGVKDVILDAELAGILAHEAIGHTTEADGVLGGSIAGNYLNQKVASELITLVDFANTAMGELCPVPVFIDDEGTIAKDAVIIEKGVLKGYMNSKETANELQHELTGNARAYSFSDEPLVRMRNTVILPGTSKLADMIASIDDGYYLIRSSNGQADSTSEFMFGITLGYEIKNGKLGKAIKDTTISGVAFDVLKTVSMVSDDMHWDSSGMCGKKQSIPTAMGGPAIKCKVNIGGK